MLSRIEIEVDCKIIDGWIDSFIEYAILEITVAKNPSSFHLFWVDHATT